MTTETQTAPAPPQIYELLPKVARDVGAIGKDNRNQQQNYRFRSVDQVLNQLHGALSKHGVALSVAVRDRETTTLERDKKLVTRTCLLLDVTFHAPDGSSITSTAAGEGMDFGGDKASNKAMAAGFKYAVFLGLSVPVAADAIDDSDRDPGPPAETPRPNGRKPAAPPKAAPPAETPNGNRATAQQVQAIRNLAKKLKCTKAQMEKALTARGVSRLEDLHQSEAAEIIGHLTERTLQ